MTTRSRHPPDRVVTSAEGRRGAILDAIRQATSRITLSLFRCTDKALFEELAAAVRRGVDVQVLVTSRAKGGKKTLGKLWTRLESTGASLHAYTDAVVKYHAKYLVVDDGPALIVSLNFTKKCFAQTCDAIVVTYDPAVVRGLRDLMLADCEGRAAPDTLPERLIVGPERARRQFTALVEQAKSSIFLIDAKLSDPGIVAMLNARRAQGLRVEIHGERHVAGMKSHGKIMLIDGERAVVGSLALTALSLDFRREVAVAFDEPAAVADIELLFRSITKAGGRTHAAPPAATGGSIC
jgi:cardiolipin synthase A/B